MISNEERREVAARLRYVAEHGAPEWATIACCIAECLGKDDYPLWRSGGEKLFDRLADLIEPEPERTCKNITDGYVPFHCSECDCVTLYDDFRETGIMAEMGMLDAPNYCPNCGAKVDQ